MILLAAVSSVRCPKANLYMYVCLINIPVDIRRDFVDSTHRLVMESAHSIFYFYIFVVLSSMGLGFNGPASTARMFGASQHMKTAL